MKRLLILLLLLILGFLLPVGCTLKNPHSIKVEQTPDNVLRLYNWATYIDPTVLQQFEREFNVTVEYETYASDDELYAKLKGGNPGYDVIFPSDYLVAIMAKKKLLEEINLDNIPNLKNIDSKFLKLFFDPENKHSLPYQWGTMGIGYNLKSIGGEVDSWEFIFDPKYRNRVAFVDEMRTMFGAVLIYLGYDPNTTDYSEITKARDYIIQHKETIATFAPDTGQSLLDKGAVDIAVEWSGDIFQVMKKNLDLRYTIPKEGTIIWIDSLAIPKRMSEKS